MSGNGRPCWAPAGGCAENGSQGGQPWRTETPPAVLQGCKTLAAGVAQAECRCGWCLQGAYSGRARRACSGSLKQKGSMRRSSQAGYAELATYSLNTGPRAARFARRHPAVCTYAARHYRVWPRARQAVVCNVPHAWGALTLREAPQFPLEGWGPPRYKQLWRPG